MIRVHVRWMFASLALLAACGGGGTGTDPCVEGATLPCDCRVGDMCFTGTQVCASGSFGACQCAVPASDAGLEMCSAPADGGTDGGDAGPVDAGCMEGASETRASSSCGEETRTCTGGVWGDWTETTPGPADIQCRRGEAQFANRDGCDGQEVRWRRCGDDCHWETTVSECGGGCAGTRRTSPADQEEICVPAGSFVVGCDDPYEGVTQHEDCYPRHEVYLSAFYIDRHVVSVTRYQQCVDAGACTPLEAYDYSFRYRGSTYLLHFDDLSLLGPGFDLNEPEVWTATHDQALAFCEWDGASLVTGAQWERAATGVYERARWPFTGDLTLHSPSDWCGDTSPGGPHGVSLECGGTTSPHNPVNRGYETSRAFIESSIGLTNMYNYFEWSSDTLAPYAPTPMAGPIPVDPHVVGGTGFELRGTPLELPWSEFGSPSGDSSRELWHRNGTHYESTDSDGSVWGWGDPNHAAFRCARPAEGTRESR